MPAFSPAATKRLRTVCTPHLNSESTISCLADLCGSATDILMRFLSSRSEVSLGRPVLGLSITACLFEFQTKFVNCRKCCFSTQTLSNLPVCVSFISQCYSFSSFLWSSLHSVSNSGGPSTGARPESAHSSAFRARWSASSMAGPGSTVHSRWLPQSCRRLR